MWNQNSFVFILNMIDGNFSLTHVIPGNMIAALNRTTRIDFSNDGETILV